MEKNNNHGGKRAGSGRKKIENKKRQVTFTASISVFDFLKKIEKKSKYIESAIIEKIEKENKNSQFWHEKINKNDVCN